MTREEASEIIIKERDSLKANPRVKVEDCLYEAFDLAIKALEHEPVLDKIKAEIEELPNTYYFGEFGAYTNRDDVKKIIDKYRSKSEE